MKILIPIGFFIIILGIAYVSFNTRERVVKHKIVKEKPKIVKEKPIINKQKENPVLNMQEEILTKWVYKHSKRCSMNDARRIVKIASNYKYRLWLLALIATESHFDSHAYSRTGAIGLGQVMSFWVKELKENKILERKTDLWDIEYNMKATEYILEKFLAKANGDFKKSLTYYFGRKSKHYTDKVYSNLGSLVISLDIR